MWLKFIVFLDFLVEEEVDFGTPKEIMKENFYKTMTFFCKTNFNASHYTSEEMLFIRQYKMMGMADPDKVPTKLTEGNLDQISRRALATDLGISRSKLRITGSFVKKSRQSKISDDPEVIVTCQNK